MVGIHVHQKTVILHGASHKIPADFYLFLKDESKPLVESYLTWIDHPLVRVYRDGSFAGTTRYVRQEHVEN